MEYIKEYNEYNNRYLDRSEYQSLLGDCSNKLSIFSKKEINKIHLSIRKNLHMSTETESCIHIYSNSFTEIIEKIEDEWYLATHSDVYGDRYYLIDGFDGLINYIKKI